MRISYLDGKYFNDPDVIYFVYHIAGYPRDKVFPLEFPTKLGLVFSGRNYNHRIESISLKIEDERLAGRSLAPILDKFNIGFDYKETKSRTKGVAERSSRDSKKYLRFHNSEHTCHVTTTYTEGRLTRLSFLQWSDPIDCYPEAKEFYKNFPKSIENEIVDKYGSEEQKKLLIPAQVIQPFTPSIFCLPGKAASAPEVAYFLSQVGMEYKSFTEKDKISIVHEGIDMEVEMSLKETKFISLTLETNEWDDYKTKLDTTCPCQLPSKDQ